MNDAAPAPAGKRRRILTTLALIFAVLGGVWWLMSHYVWGLREHTDDAYVAGHQISVSSQVPGTVIEVTVDNTALVEAGQVLVRLDPIDAATALARAEAQLAQAVRQVRQQRAVAQQQDAQIAQRVPDEFLGPAFGIDVGRVDEVDARIKRLLDQRGGGWLVQTGNGAKPPTVVAKRHRAKAQLGTNQAG